MVLERELLSVMELLPISRKGRVVVLVCKFFHGCFFSFSLYYLIISFCVRPPPVTVNIYPLVIVNFTPVIVPPLFFFYLNFSVFCTCLL